MQINVAHDDGIVRLSRHAFNLKSTLGFRADEKMFVPELGNSLRSFLGLRLPEVPNRLKE